MPNVTEKKIKELNEPDLEGPPTHAEAETAFDGIYLGLHKYDYASFPRPIEGLQPHTQYGITKTVLLDRSTNHTVSTCTTKPLKKCNSENNVPNGLKRMLST